MGGGGGECGEIGRNGRYVDRCAGSEEACSGGGYRRREDNSQSRIIGQRTRGRNNTGSTGVTGRHRFVMWGSWTTHAQLRWRIELPALHLVYENGRAQGRKMSGCGGNSEKAGWLRRKLYRDTILYRTRRPSQRGGAFQHCPNLGLAFQK